MRMSNYTEALSWVREWRGHLSPTGFLEHLRKAIKHHRANAEAIARDRDKGRRIDFCDPDEYLRSVEMLEAELEPAWRRATRHALVREIARDQRSLRQKKYRDAVMAKHGNDPRFREYR